jgi:hypothetical protein
MVKVLLQNLLKVINDLLTLRFYVAIFELVRTKGAALSCIESAVFNQ